MFVVIVLLSLSLCLGCGWGLAFDVCWLLWLCGCLLGLLVVLVLRCGICWGVGFVGDLVFVAGLCRLVGFCFDRLSFVVLALCVGCWGVLYVLIV